jgi:hypothetical protein
MQQWSAETYNSMLPAVKLQAEKCLAILEVLKQVTALQQQAFELRTTWTSKTDDKLTMMQQMLQELLVREKLK